MLSTQANRHLNCQPGRRQAAKQSFAQRQRKDAKVGIQHEVAELGRDAEG